MHLQKNGWWWKVGIVIVFLGSYLVFESWGDLDKRGFHSSRDLDIQSFADEPHVGKGGGYLKQARSTSAHILGQLPKVVPHHGGLLGAIIVYGFKYFRSLQPRSLKRCFLRA